MDNVLIKPKAQLEFIKDVEQEKHYKHIGQIRLKPGLKLYQLNVTTIELKEVEIVKQKMINFQKQKVLNDKAIYDPKCMYFQALNQENAEKKAAKIISKILDSSKDNR